MRRFQDGSIKEAVVWGRGGGQGNVEERRDICQRIITHLLQRLEGKNKFILQNPYSDLCF